MNAWISLLVLRVRAVLGTRAARDAIMIASVPVGALVAGALIVMA